MLITRLCGTTDYSHWPCTQYSRPPSRPQSPRMSEKKSLPSPLQPEWQGQYSYSRLETDPHQRPSLDTRNDLDRHRANSTTSMRHQYQSQDLKLQSLAHDSIRNLGNPNLQLGRPTSSLYGSTTSTGSKLSGTISRDSLGTDISPYLRQAETSHFYRPQGDQTSAAELSQSDRDDKERSSSQDADFDVYDDDVDDTDRGSHCYHQTVAERIAARRKMKRFRLTHQQTRFLTSEFAKQPHPDAAHRERLSREIPGLSPRQVQVWFQNRRAKIKRLTVDDRERMIRMRAVPDNFDNLQAFHSPYGAVHGAGAAVSPSSLGPMGYSYGGHEARPLMLDLRSSAGESYMSPTRLSQPFAGIDMGHSGSGPRSGMLSLSSNVYGDGHAAGSSSASSTPGLGYQTSTPYWNSTADKVDMSSPHSHSGIRDLQCSQRRDWSSRHALDSTQTPLSLCNRGGAAASNPPGRQISYPNPSTGTLGGCETQSYSDLSGLPGRDSRNDTELEGPGRHRAGSPPGAMDYGFKDQLRESNTASVSAPFPDRPQGLPSLNSDTSSPASHTTGPLSAPLETPLQQSFRMQSEKMGEYPTSQMNAPGSQPSSDSNRPFRATTPTRTPTPTRNSSGGPLKDLFGHGVL